MPTSFFEHADARDLNPSHDHLPARRLLAFSALSVPIAAAYLPLNIYLPIIYAREFGIPLTVIGTIFFVEKLWSAAADAIIGASSDRTRSRFGRRRLWIAAGAIVFELCALLLFFPKSSVTPLYLGLALFFLQSGWSMLQIPFLAWSGEISSGYNERTRVATYQMLTVV